MMKKIWKLWKIQISHSMNHWLFLINNEEKKNEEKKNEKLVLNYNFVMTSVTSTYFVIDYILYDVCYLTVFVISYFLIITSMILYVPGSHLFFNCFHKRMTNVWWTYDDRMFVMLVMFVIHVSNLCHTFVLLYVIWSSYLICSNVRNRSSYVRHTSVTKRSWTYNRRMTNI